MPPALCGLEDLPALVPFLQKQDHHSGFRMLLSQYQNQHQAAHVGARKINVFFTKHLSDNYPVSVSAQFTAQPLQFITGSDIKVSQICLSCDRESLPLHLPVAYQ